MERPIKTHRSLVYEVLGSGSAQVQRLLLDFPSLLLVVAEEGAVAVAKDLLVAGFGFKVGVRV